MSSEKLIKLKLGDLRFVEVIWHDAHSNDEWQNWQDVVLKPARVVTRGFIVREDDRLLMVAGTIGTEDGLVADTCSTITIPKGMIESVAPYPLRRKRVKKVKDASTDNNA